jgi:hypothetical protein
MTRIRLVLLLSGVALVAIGVLAGSVIGDDGTTRMVNRISTAYPAAEKIAIGGTQLRGGGGKAKIISGSSKKRTVASATVDSVEIRCPKKTVAISAGFNTQGPGLIPMNIGRAGGKARNFFIAIYNSTSGDLSWWADITCEKGVKFG